MKAAKNKEEKQKIKLNGLVIAMAVLFIIIGLAMIFLIPEYITFVQICYLLDLAVLACGIFYIVRYFLKESYKNLQEYGFSIGTMLVIIGVIATVRAPVMAEYFIFAVGVFMLLASIFKLQTALDLNALHDRSFILWLCIAVVFAGCAVVTIMDPFKNAETLEQFLQYALIADGVLSLAGSLYLYFRVRTVKKLEEGSENAGGSATDPTDAEGDTAETV